MARRRSDVTLGDSPFDGDYMLNGLAPTVTDVSQDGRRWLVVADGGASNVQARPGWAAFVIDSDTGQVWNPVPEGSLNRVIDGEEVTTAARRLDLSPDGRFLAVVEPDDNSGGPYRVLVFTDTQAAPVHLAETGSAPALVDI